MDGERCNSGFFGTNFEGDLTPTDEVLLHLSVSPLTFHFTVTTAVISGLGHTANSTLTLRC